MSTEKVTINACQGWGCHEHCMLETHTVDGKIVRTQRLPLPGPKPDNGICAKGIMAAKIPYAEDRVLHPLKRVGERGEGKFEQISWDQALDEIAEKLLEIKDKYGEQSVILNEFWCGYPGDYRSLQNSLIFRFAHTFGASIIEYADVDDAPSYMFMVDYGVYSTTDNKQLTKSNNEIIVWGGNPLGFTRPTVTSRMLLDAQERGAKLVHISNMFDNTSAKADQWVPAKSGTDAALALAMANYIVQAGEVDEQYLIDHSVGPFLVRSDNGMFLRESDIKADGNPYAYVYIDANSNEPSVIMPRAEFPTDPVLNVEAEVSGIACKSAYRVLVEKLSEWTPEKQEEITGVPAATCIQLIRDYLDNRPSTIYIYYGFRYRNGGQTARAIDLLPILSGNLGMPGGRFIVSGSADTSTKYTVMNDGPIYFPYGFEGLKGDHIPMQKVLDSFEDPSVQQYKAWLNPMGNPILNW
ncbi:MAG: molybdopterin-dependent oxidoreductase, partial [Eggerthellaceae bacterium]|nr:molybdopterin-dependent oxidoreductase [Eggerthellaceae bacterium]